MHIAAQQLRAGQWSITANLWPLTANVYHVMIIVTSGIYFYQYHFYFLEFLLNYLELVFLQFKHIYKPQRTSLFPFYLFIFYLMFHNHSVYSCFPTACKHTGWVCSLFDCCLQSLYVITLSTFCTRAGSLNRTPLPYQFSRWRLNFLKMSNLMSTEIRMSKLPKVRYTNSPCCSVLLWTNFSFLPVNQQNCVGVVSTNNITYPVQIYTPF